MKNIYLILFTTFSFCFSNSTAFGQYIDSIYIIPENPKINDEISIVIQITTPTITGKAISKIHNRRNDTLFIELCYAMGPLPSNETLTDTFDLGKLIPDNFVVHVTANLSFLNPCVSVRYQIKIQNFPSTAGNGDNLLKHPYIKLYPNPCKNELLVLGRNFNQINIIDYQGIVVHQIMVDDRNEKRINIETLAKGLYIIECLQKGVTVYRQKIIKN